MKRKSIAVFGCVVLLAFCSGCGTQTKEPEPTIPMENEASTEAKNTEAKNTEAENTESKLQEGDVSETEQIQSELALVENASLEFENADWGSMAQMEMNQLAAQWYQLWDDELNSLWQRLNEEADEQIKAELLEEQRAWIRTKEGNVKAAGEEALGGSLQPLLENTVAEEMTRARVYVLAGYLADIRQETFAVPVDVQESIDEENPSLDDVFQQFEGQWIFDESRGACVGVERTGDCAYGVEGSNWTVWVTGGDVFSDLDVYGYTDVAIIFKIAYTDSEAYYKLFRNGEDVVCLAYGTSFDGMDDVIVCE